MLNKYQSYIISYRGFNTIDLLTYSFNITFKLTIKKTQTQHVIEGINRETNKDTSKIMRTIKD